MELLPNFAASTLSVAVGATDTAFVVADATSFPSPGTYRCRIDEELVKVTAKSGNTLTVQRGIEGTTATPHAADVDCFTVLTAEGLTTFIAENGGDLAETVQAALEALDASLKPVAKSGAYADLTGTPNLATVATSGAYNDLSGKPALGTAAAQDSTAFAAAAHTQAISTIVGLVTALAGKADLDGDGKILASQIAAIAISEPFECADEAAMLALTAEKGDVAIRLDVNKCFMLATNSPSTLADWKELRTPTDVVLSVAGLTGTISAAALRAALSLATVATSGAYADLSGKPTLGTAAALDVGTTANKVVQLDSGGKLPALDGSQLTGISGGGGGGFETLTSGPTVTLDFSANEMAKLVVGHNVTFAFSNLAAGKRKELILSSGATYGFTYPAGIKNVGGTGLPATIVAGDNFTLRFSSAGTTDAEVRVEFVNGAGVVFALTAAPDQSCDKGSSDTFSLATGVTGGPNLGYVTVSISASVGTFYVSDGLGKLVETLDGDSGRPTDKTFMSSKSTLETHFSGFTWYPPTSGGIPTTGSGTVAVAISDGVNSKTFSVGVRAYGGNELQQIDWQFTGSSYSPQGGTYTVSVPGYGTTGPIEASGGNYALQIALNSLMGGDAPNVGGTAATPTLEFANGEAAHTDIGDISVTPSGVHDGSCPGWSSPMQSSYGDGSSMQDSFTGAWDYYAIGSVDWGGGPVPKVAYGGSSTTFSIGGVSYTLTDYGSSYSITCNDYDSHGALGGTPNYGNELSPNVTTINQGDT